MKRANQISAPVIYVGDIIWIDYKEGLVFTSRRDMEHHFKNLRDFSDTTVLEVQIKDINHLHAENTLSFKNVSGLHI